MSSSRLSFSWVQPCVIFFLCLLSSIKTNADNIGIIYPEIREPYLHIFLNIKEGIEKEIGKDNKIFAYVIPKDESPEKVGRWIEKKKITAIVALGSRGINSISPSNNIPSVVGAAVLKPGSSSYSGITLNPAPDILLSSAVKLKPTIKKIHVVYEPEKHEWVITEAQQQLKKHDIELIPHAIEGLRSAADK